MHAVALDATFHVSGLVDVPLVVVKLKRTRDYKASPQYLLVTDDKGRITHVTSQLARRLGTTASKMQSSNGSNAMEMLLPEPFVKLHRWVREHKHRPICILYALQNRTSFFIGPCAVRHI